MQKIGEINTVSIVGTGNVATHLGRAFYGSGIRIESVCSRTFITADKLAKELAASTSASLSEIDRSDLVLICVKDNSIREVAEALTDHPGILCHTSGSIGMDVFDKRKGPSGIFYPLQTFSKNVEMTYNKIPFFLEGDGEDTLVMLEELAGKLSKSVYRLNSEGRARLHLASVFACNFSNHMVAIASRILEREGLKQEMIMPLLEQTLNKLKISDPLSAQTGPAVRKDSAVIQKHLEFLSSYPEEQELYKLLSENIMKYGEL